MHHLFQHMKMTTAIDEIRTTEMPVYNRYFRPVARAATSTKIQFDVLTGEMKLLPNISPRSQATVIDNGGRKTITIAAPRYADSFKILDADLEELRKFGDLGPEMMKDEIRRKMKLLRGPHDMTMEYNACNLLTQGKILDSDGSELLDYGLDVAHKPVLAGNDLWSDTTNSKPTADIREWKRLIIKDLLGVPVTRWEALAGWEASGYLQDHPTVRDIIKETESRQIVREDAMDYRIKGVEVMEYNTEYVPESGVPAAFIPQDMFILIGICDQWVDAQFAPIMDSTVKDGVGNVAPNANGKIRMVPYMAKPTRQENPGAWEIVAEQRQLVIIKRVAAIVAATVA